MKQSNDTALMGLVAPYNQIQDYVIGMSLTDVITALYVRISRDDKDKMKEDDSDSIVNQKKILAKFAQDHHLQNPVFFVDDGVSGTTFDRDDFQAAMDLVTEGIVKNFVVKDLSRFGRDYLKVGSYLEGLLQDMDVRFIAVNDGVDSNRGENDMVPIRNLFNEWYARDTSKKVRAVLRAKALAGEPMCSRPPFGYAKDPNDKKRWLVDEEAADVVRKIFHWCMEGLGPAHIANRLKEMRVETPTVYWIRKGLKTNRQPQANPYDWDGATISDILSHREYLGHIVNFKCHKKSYKSKKRIWHDPSEHVVFENAHPAIIDQDTFDRVQQIRSGRRRHNSSGRVGLFSGLAFCKDCGKKMYFCAASTMKPEQDYYVCSGFRSKTAVCASSHYMRVAVLEKMVLKHIQTMTTNVSQHETDFVAMLRQDQAEIGRKETLKSKGQISKMRTRLTEIDDIVKKLYEDRVFGRLTDEMFDKLSQGYTQEQQTLREQADFLERQLAEQEEERVNVNSFLARVRKYTNVTELSPLLLHELIDRIEVHAPDKSSGKRTQDISVHYRFVGVIGKLDFAKGNEPPTHYNKKVAENI
jgi:DNA invertase Pin-like site-specific DNA recombinase